MAGVRKVRWWYVDLAREEKPESSVLPSRHTCRVEVLMRFCRLT